MSSDPGPAEDPHHPASPGGGDSPPPSATPRGGDGPQAARHARPAGLAGTAALIESQIRRNQLLTGVLVLAAAANAGVIALFAAGFTHDRLTALYVLGALVCVAAAGMACASALARSRLASLGGPAGERAARLTEQVAEWYGIPVPQVIMLPDDGLNALALGTGTRAVVAYTRGLLDELDDDELRAVAAHELAHVAGRDSRLAAFSVGLLYWAITVSAVTGAVASVIAGIGRGFAHGTRDDQDDPTGGLLRLAFLITIYTIAVMVFLFGLLWSAIAHLTHLALVRQREWRADAMAAQVLGQPELLARALTRLRDADTALARGGRMLQSLCLADRPRPGQWLADMLSTHPSTERRIARLRGAAAGQRRGSGLVLPLIAGAGTTALAAALTLGVLHIGPPAGAGQAAGLAGGLASPGTTSGTAGTGGSTGGGQSPSARNSPAVTSPGPSPAATATGPPSPGASGGPSPSASPQPSATAHPGGTPPAAPSGVTATANGQYQITVTWVNNATDATGFDIDNGCPPGSCAPGATLSRATGVTTSTSFVVTPGSYSCFRVRAVNSAGTSAWAEWGCAQTPGFTVPGARPWADTGVNLPSGIDVKITASGTAYIDPSYPVGPAGDPSCTPDVTYPGISPPFLAATLPCWSLIARIGNGTPFEVGPSSTFTTTSGGELYLSVNDNNFTDNSGSWTADIEKGG